MKSSVFFKYLRIPEFPRKCFEICPESRDAEIGWEIDSLEPVELKKLFEPLSHKVWTCRVFPNNNLQLQDLWSGAERYKITKELYFCFSDFFNKFQYCFEWIVKIVLSYFTFYLHLEKIIHHLASRCIATTNGPYVR